MNYNSDILRTLADENHLDSVESLTSPLLEELTDYGTSTPVDIIDLPLDSKEIACNLFKHLDFDHQGNISKHTQISGLSTVLNLCEEFCHSSLYLQQDITSAENKKSSSINKREFQMDSNLLISDRATSDAKSADLLSSNSKPNPFKTAKMQYTDEVINTIDFADKLIQPEKKCCTGWENRKHFEQTIRKRKS